jgi:hypothetical protein
MAGFVEHTDNMTLLYKRVMKPSDENDTLLVSIVELKAELAQIADKPDVMKRYEQIIGKRTIKPAKAA